jgi:gliding motility associated protien GldN
MNRKILSGITIFFLAGIINAQTFKDIYQKSNSDNRKMDFPYLREGDVVWSKKYYRIIDLREKINLPLYYPLATSQPADGRKSFITIILNAVKQGKLNAYDVNIAVDSLPVSMTYKDVEKNLGAGEITIQVQDTATGIKVDKKINQAAEPSDVKQLMLYEEWFFDKKHSKLDVRIIGISPIFMGIDRSTQKPIRNQVFWIRYDEARDLLSKYEVFNTKNDAQRISFDDLFMQRRFDSYIVGESNVYNDRSIIEYATGRDAMFEAERIKKDLFNFEHDLWEY